MRVGEGEEKTGAADGHVFEVAGELSHQSDRLMAEVRALVARIHAV